jgi:hypothetical protein
MVNNSAVQNGTTIIFTRNMRDQANAAWSSEMISLAESFSATYKIHMGDYYVGGDGIAFVFQRDPDGLSAIGGFGKGLGFGNIAGSDIVDPVSPSLAIEIDTFYNPEVDGDFTADHIGLVANGRMGNYLYGPVQASAVNANIKDGRDHIFRVEWNEGGLQTLNVYFDDVLRVSYSADIVSEILGGSPEVYFGFTGATGTRVVCSIFTATRNTHPFLQARR